MQNVFSQKQRIEMNTWIHLKFVCLNVSYVALVKCIQMVEKNTQDYIHSQLLLVFQKKNSVSFCPK